MTLPRDFAEQERRRFWAQKKENDMFDIRKPLPPNKAAAEAASRAWSKFDRMRAMLERAESECCSGHDAAMCGELEDLELMLSQVLRGPVQSKGGA